jgi:hypothetical protein
MKIENETINQLFDELVIIEKTCTLPGGEWAGMEMVEWAEEWCNKLRDEGLLSEEGDNE